ncbi:hypothetical protein NEOLI_002851 [Neolecta irregularis DAH-3]|uniref:Uncharacterized protein n=1 Tax=Neolecta irregularis (strain DAH-3) TaxID=1198029 RepID=A0A1U7LQD3_NEOID|nr:hypothetical protein NEOLI_002851 [Neolecta irregularis DAH-3]|eukprot:OLL24854.1 hypothetical protein NEOLI_002851 [Neolecta irregularis DAH-3]
MKQPEFQDPAPSPYPSKVSQNEIERLEKFVLEAPREEYTFFSDRGSQESEICREGNGYRSLPLLVVRESVYQALKCLKD